MAGGRLHRRRIEIFARVISVRCRGGAPRSESKSNDRRGRSLNNSTAISRPPPLQIFEQNRYTQTKLSMLQIVPCFDMIPPNFICKCLVLHCRRFAPTLFPRWGNNRAADSRPYADGATEFPGRKFRCVVGADSIRPPTWQIFEQNRYTPTGAPMLRIFHVSTLYHRISFANVRYCIVGALRRRCFPVGETTGRLIAAPTTPRNFRSGNSVAPPMRPLKIPIETMGEF